MQHLARDPPAQTGTDKSSRGNLGNAHSTRKIKLEVGKNKPGDAGISPHIKWIFTGFVSISFHEYPPFLCQGISKGK